MWLRPSGGDRFVSLTGGGGNLELSDVAGDFAHREFSALLLRGNAFYLVCPGYLAGGTPGKEGGD